MLHSNLFSSFAFIIFISLKINISKCSTQFSGMAEFIGMILDYKAINYAYEEVLQIEPGTESKDNPLKNIFSEKFRKIANKIVIKDKQSILKRN